MLSLAPFFILTGDSAGISFATHPKAKFMRSTFKVLFYRNGIPATELRLCPIDCNPSHDGDNTVFLLASVHEEQHLECASCHTRFFCLQN